SGPRSVLSSATPLCFAAGTATSVGSEIGAVGGVVASGSPSSPLPPSGPRAVLSSATPLCFAAGTDSSWAALSAAAGSRGTLETESPLGLVTLSAIPSIPRFLRVYVSSPDAKSALFSAVRESRGGGGTDV